MHTLHSLREAAANTWWRLTAWAGHPHEIARHGFASRRVSRLMRDWIVHLEKLVRRLVYLAALTLEVPQPAPARTGPRSPGAAPVIPGRRPSLRLLFKWREPTPRWGLGKWRRHDPDYQWQPVRIGHFARRMEALRHAIWHTQPHALRLARVLARRTAANRPLPQTLVSAATARRFTSGESEVYDAFHATGALIVDALRKRGAYIDPWAPWEEPG